MNTQVSISKFLLALALTLSLGVVIASIWYKHFYVEMLVSQTTCCIIDLNSINEIDTLKENVTVLIELKSISDEAALVFIDGISVTGIIITLCIIGIFFISIRNEQ